MSVGIIILQPVETSLDSRVEPACVEAQGIAIFVRPVATDADRDLSRGIRVQDQVAAVRVQHETALDLAGDAHLPGLVVELDGDFGAIPRGRAHMLGAFR